MITKTILSVISLLLVFQHSQGQNCYVHIDSSTRYYDQKMYKEALVCFKRALTNNCKLNNIEYYNGACIASLAGQPVLANQWLTKSVELGYNDTLHMAEDTDLDPIRKSPGYKQVIVKIRKKGEALLKSLKVIKTNEDFIYAVPYEKNGKWGWLHLLTGKPMTPPDFSFTDFVSYKGLYLERDGQGYFWTREGQLLMDKMQDYFSDMGPVGLMDMRQDPERRKEAGFTEYNGQIQSYSDEFLNLTMLTPYYKGRPLAIAKNKQGLTAIIRSDGSIHEPFGFKYKQLIPVKCFEDQYLVQAVKEGASTYTLLSLEGEQVFPEPFTALKEVSSYDYNPLPPGRHFFTGISMGKYIILTTAKGSCVYSLEYKKAITGYYDKIILTNGRTSDANRQGSYGNHGVDQPFFLVEHKGSMFYVDMTGKELRVGGK